MEGKEKKKWERKKKKKLDTTTTELQATAHPPILDEP